MSRNDAGTVSPTETHPAKVARPEAHRSRHPFAFLGRVILFLLGTLILFLAVLLPYKARLWLSDAIGKVMNAVYHAYIRLFRWFLKKLEDD